MTRLSERFYVFSLAGGYGAAVLVLLMRSLGIEMGFFMKSWEWRTEMAIWAGVCLAYFYVILLILVYKMWAGIQDGHASVGPKLAAGLLLVPGVNAYWIFRVLLSFVRDYNAYIKRHTVQTAPLEKGLFLAVPILFFLDAVPWIWWLAGGVNTFLLALLAGTICEAVNALPERPAAGSASGQ